MSKANDYSVLAKAGGLRNGAQRGHGSIFHAVNRRYESERNADVAASGREALCGARPRIMWGPEGAQVTCPRCRKKLEGGRGSVRPSHPIREGKFVQLPLVLDVCCGPRGFWFNRADERALFVDNRMAIYPADLGTLSTQGRSPIVVKPDVLASFTALPFADESFALVIFDPPHAARAAPLGFLTKRYGHLTGDWRKMLRHGFAECFRVMKREGTLIFKWAESSYPVAEILKLAPQQPLFGQRTKSTTHWLVFMKQHSSEECVRRNG